ncbi:Ribosomal protein L24 [Candidatus Magnetobacterium bavaricum]|uniref:Large ribosomal subunit protein uL24 n=1 Tax=Candidatus Magnetobacterium bavaricum TaxID=29290 RepID=A0A0F3GI99_9BACT|nr:Ribosomal protein L24 [Candidatus Magnetobacterium bavaricum]
MGLSIKKEDTVVIITGSDAGKKGRVVRVIPKKASAIVENTNMITKHMKPNKQYSQGGRIEKEAPIDLSKLMLVCPRCSKPTRIGNQVLEGGKKTRLCKKCKEVID